MEGRYFVTLRMPRRGYTGLMDGVEASVEAAEKEKRLPFLAYEPYFENGDAVVDIAAVSPAAANYAAGLFRSSGKYRSVEVKEEALDFSRGKE